MRYKVMATTMSLAALMALDVRAHAAAVDGPSIIRAQSDAQVEDIIVTAERRSRNVQDVTGTVDAYSAKELENLKIENINDIQALTPGLVVTRLAASTNIYLRGVGTVSAGDAEPSVATYIDGFYVPNSNSTFFSFNNIERVEILKGPQGTLYGRNASAGLVHVITRDPGSEPNLNASVGYGNYNTLKLDAYGSTPITDNLAVNVSVTHTNQKDGFGINLFNGHDVRKFKETGVEAKAVWTPTDTTRITLRGMYDHVNSDQQALGGTFPGALAGDGTPFLGRDKYSMRRDPNSRTTVANGGLKLEQDLGFAEFKSLTGYFHTKTDAEFEFLGIPGNTGFLQGAIEQDHHFHSSTFSQEFELSSKNSGTSRFEWIAGLFYYNDEFTLDAATYSTCIGNVCSIIPPPIRTVGKATTKSYAGYGEGTYRVFDHTKLTLGLRYTKDSKGLSGLSTPYTVRPNGASAAFFITTPYPGAPYPGNPNGIPTSVSYSKLTYKAVLAQDFTDMIHGYASYNRGFKAGGYSPNNFANVPSKPETVDAFEVGLKSELLDRMLRVNIAGFYYDYKDIQVSTLAPPAPPGGGITYNAAAARVKGFDADFVLAPTPQLTINTSLEYLDSKFTKFLGASCTVANIVGSPDPFGGTYLGGVQAIPCDLTGRPLVNSPHWSVSFGATYTVDTSLGQFALAANDAYTSRYALEPTNRLTQKPLHLVSASLTWKSPDKRFDVQLWAKNLTNAFYFAAAAASISDAYIPTAPRTYGAQFGVHF